MLPFGGLTYLNITRREFAALTPEEKFELNLPEEIRKAAINAEQNPYRKEQLYYRRQVGCGIQLDSRMAMRCPPALPFCHSVIKAEKPKPAGYPAAVVYARRPA